MIRFCSEGLLALLGWERAGRGQEVAGAQLRREMTVVWAGEHVLMVLLLLLLSRLSHVRLYVTP